ncbi:MAG: hypothetical protein ACI8WT_004592, partial [Clostridium sp.]
MQQNIEPLKFLFGKGNQVQRSPVNKHKLSISFPTYV